MPSNKFFPSFSLKNIKQRTWTYDVYLSEPLYATYSWVGHACPVSELLQFKTQISFGLQGKVTQQRQEVHDNDFWQWTRAIGNLRL